MVKETTDITQIQRWQRRKDDRPAEIVSAALEVFCERGFTAARIGDIAERAAVSKGTVYLYFDSKEELLKAVVREALVVNLAQAEKITQAHSGTSAELLTNIILMLGHNIAATRLGAIVKIVIAESGNFPDLAKFYFDEVISRGLGLLRTVIWQGVERGEFRLVDPDQTARLAVAPVILTAIWKNTFEDYEPLQEDQLLQAHVDNLLQGLAAT